MTRKKVLLGFSGGIDSTHAVKILSEQGYIVTALTLDTHSDTEFLSKAASRADQLGINMIIKDVRGEFRDKIISYFLSEYSAGRTPAPCTMCNRHIKWKHLYETAITDGYDFIATGHYFSITNMDGTSYISRAADRRKDQSYYLWDIPQEYRQKILTPMCDQIKEEITRISPTGQRESMGI